jgi:hypothetical protein
MSSIKINASTCNLHYVIYVMMKRHVHKWCIGACRTRHNSKPFAPVAPKDADLTQALKSCVRCRLCRWRWFRHLSTRFPRWENEKKARNRLETLIIAATIGPKASAMKSQTSAMTKTSSTTSRTKVRPKFEHPFADVTRALLMAAPGHPAAFHALKCHFSQSFVYF